MICLITSILDNDMPHHFSIRGRTSFFCDYLTSTYDIYSITQSGMRDGIAMVQVWSSLWIIYICIYVSMYSSTVTLIMLMIKQLRILLCCTYTRYCVTPVPVPSHCTRLPIEVRLHHCLSENSEWDCLDLRDAIREDRINRYFLDFIFISIDPCNMQRTCSGT